ncbi:MAG TPA: biopolymer transporter ExbD [Phycisphaerae bacterium]|nr:biopolymer transporter ExbD [Phycisphaerae bacterium]
MAKPVRARAGSVSFNMTPMIDIIFNLIIFFMLISQFVQLEIEDVMLPTAEAAKVMDYSQFRNVVINIVKVEPDGSKVKILGSEISSDISTGVANSELTQFLKTRTELEDRGKVNVILRADADIPYEDVARVMLCAGGAGIEGWWITTEIEEPEER